MQYLVETQLRNEKIESDHMVIEPGGVLAFYQRKRLVKAFAHNYWITVAPALTVENDPPKDKEECKHDKGTEGGEFFQWCVVCGKAVGKNA